MFLSFRYCGGLAPGLDFLCFLCRDVPQDGYTISHGLQLAKYVGCFVASGDPYKTAPGEKDQPEVPMRLKEFQSKVMQDYYKKHKSDLQTDNERR